MPRVRARDALLIALFFGGFQGLMPLLGYFLGRTFASYIDAIDHYIAFALLAIIGGKMIFDAFHEKPKGEGEYRFDLKELLLMAVATSIDALAVGVTLSFFAGSIFFSCAVIAAVTFVLSLAGVGIGNFFGARFGKGAQVAGGVLLALMGVKILLEHLGVIPG